MMNQRPKINVMSLVGRKRKRNDPLEKQMAETIKKLKKKVEEEKISEEYFVIEADKATEAEIEEIVAGVEGKEELEADNKGTEGNYDNCN